ncbi:MAG TPA: bromodomain-containing protein [Cyanophyceae cyanobacterium]
MNFKYRWKNNAPPTSRNKAAHSDNLLDESQFESKEDQELAENTARKHLGIPTKIPDDQRPVLPEAAPPDQLDF